jgi:hypothetical protein
VNQINCYIPCISDVRRSKLLVTGNLLAEGLKYCCVQDLGFKAGASGVWRYRRDELLYAGSSKTVLEAALEALHSKRTNKIGDNAFDRESKRIARLLPQPNAYPPSLYAAKQVVGVESLEQYEIHNCINVCIRYDKLACKEFSLHSDDR